LVGIGVFICVLTLWIDPRLQAFHLPKLLVIAVYEILLLLAVWLFAMWDRLGIRSLNPGPIWKRWDGLLMTALVVASYIGNVGYNILLRSYIPKKDEWWITFVRELKALGPVSFGFVAIGLALLVGLAEEAVFRAYFITRLRRSGLGLWVSILISAAAFGVIHWPDGWVAVVGNTIFWGIPTGYYFCRRGSILPLIIAHAFVDALAFVASYLIPLRLQGY